MPTPVKMPRLGESVAEGTIGAWLKKEGDEIEIDEALAEIITDKITAELPSPVAGRLTKILVQADQTVPVGTDIALVEEAAGAAPPSPEPEAPQAAPAPAASAPPAPAAPAANQAQPVPAAVGTRAASGQQAGANGQRISPLARRLAEEYNIELNQVIGTGTGGRIRKEDILAYVDAQKQQADAQAPAAAGTTATAPQPAVTAPSAPPAQAAPAQAPTPPPAPAQAGPDEELVTPDRMRLAIAEHMVRTKRTAPHATTFMEVDMTNIARWLEKNKDEFRKKNGYGISYVPFVMKATCEGLRQFPMVNASWTPDNKILLKKRINLGMAVATETGLVVPTIYDADQYTIAGLAKQVAAIAQRARSNKLTLQDMQGSTFSVNNTGTFGTMFSTPLINQPHAGILSMEAVVKRPMVMQAYGEDIIAIRHMMFLSFTFDHRILDGAGANGFLRAVRLKLESYGPDIDVY
jgi:pyruvate/2-oxoglutarate dehydrogenase complex dihydrolipoamide acyltransferase (E2) component